MDGQNEDEQRYVKSLQDAANALGVNRRTLYEWIGRGAPSKSEQGYDIHALKEWQSLNSDTRQPTTAWETDDEEEIESDSYKLRFAMAKLRKLEGEARKVAAEGGIKEFTEKKTTQDIVHLDDVEQFLSQFLTEIRRLLERMPTEMSAGYAPSVRDDMKTDLTERLDIIMRAMHGWIANVAELRE